MWLETIKSPSFYSRGLSPARYLWALCRCLIQDATVMKDIREDNDCLKAVRTIFQDNGIRAPEHWSPIRDLASTGSEDGVEYFNIAIENLRLYLNADKKLRMSLEHDVRAAESEYQQMIAEIHAVKAENRSYEEKIQKIKAFIQTQPEGPDKKQALQMIARFV